MSQVKFPALIGESPLAILAAIGTFRLIHDFADDDARLSWDPDDRAPVLHSILASIDAVVEELSELVAEMPEDVVVPGGPPGFPPPGEAPDKLRLKQGQLYERFGVDTPSPVVQRWLASLVTDLVADPQGRGAISQFTAPAGKQSMATMLEKPLRLVQSEPEYLRQALIGWRRVPGVTGEYLDHRANWDSGEDGRGKAEMRGVPGATWLALMSYPLWTTTAAGQQVRTSGWHSQPVGRDDRRSAPELRLPLWREPLGLAAVKALVEDPVLDGKWDAVEQDKLRVMGIFHVCRAHRRKAEGQKSAGVLVTVS
ncbi:hypothetical protein CWT12_09025 [Actinomyces sp. 432]|uniref:type I-G CRISPR-associated protein, Cas3-extension family n=1 Tax=Actinomyces sp. 432 TaxID=2057798 RepID=UPI0013743BDD|nr:hypothetical protein [Actinomyces sp. 432]QHO91419.1 hypothetical protein CWT12_09025 [Actinomyces sp. 432]